MNYLKLVKQYSLLEYKGGVHLRRRQSLGGVGVNQLPTFADMKGVGVIRKSMSAIFSPFLLQQHKNMYLQNTFILHQY